MTTATNGSLFAEALNLLGKSGHDTKNCEWCQSIRKIQEERNAKATSTYPAGMLKSISEAKARAAKVEENIDKLSTRNLERNFMHRATLMLENEIDQLPNTGNGVAGYLQAKGYRGDKTGVGNALAKYLRSKVMTGSYALYPFKDGQDSFNLFVEENGLILETPRYQMSLNPVKWQDWFMKMLRADEYPELLS